MPELVSTLLPLVAILAVFWLLVIWPANRRSRAMTRLHDSLQPGDRVMMSSGVYGTLRTAVGERLRLEIAPGTVIEIARAAVASKDTAAGSSESGQADTAHADTAQADTARPETPQAEIPPAENPPASGATPSEEQH